MTDNGEILIQKPISIWKRPISLRFDNLAKSLGAGVIAGAFGNWEGVASSGLSVLDNLGLREQNAGTIAWLLVQRALLQGMSDLLKDYSGNLQQEPNFKQLCEQLDLVFQKEDLTLSQDFFERPKELPIVNASQTPYCHWLKTSGLSSNDAEAISKRL
ncbi:MAG: hypothetical protein AAFN08_14770, partial [Cyanobacteria bacterium J06559_3]